MPNTKDYDAENPDPTPLSSDSPATPYQNAIFHIPENLPTTQHSSEEESVSLIGSDLNVSLLLSPNHHNSRQTTILPKKPEDKDEPCCRFCLIC